MVYIDIKYVNDHISLLREELKITDSLIDYLRHCSNQTATCGLHNMAFVEQQLYRMSNQTNYIRNRIAFLESVIEKTVDLKESTAMILDEAVSMVGTDK